MEVLMNCYILLAITLGILFLQMLSRYISDMLTTIKGQSSLTPFIDAEDRTDTLIVGSLFVISAIMFLCKDVLVWLWYAFEIPLGPWQILYGMLSGLNFISLVLPFYLPKIVSGRHKRNIKPLVHLALVFLWFSNVTVTYAVWGAFCDFCYFG